MGNPCNWDTYKQGTCGDDMHMGWDETNNGYNEDVINHPLIMAYAIFFVRLIA